MIDLTSSHVRAVMASRIEAAYDDASVELYREGNRKHLGASVIGDTCERRLWFGFRWIHNHNPGGRMYRLWQRGHREEPIVFEHLRLRGHVINEVDPATLKQWRLAALHNHFGGSCDGRGYLPASFEYADEVGYEVKTANDKQFKLFKKDGVRKWKPKYAAQMDVYGRAWGIRFFVFTVVNKNDDDKAVEIYECDWTNADRLLAKAERVITWRVPPPRLSEHPSYSECKYCDFNKHCHFGAMPDVNCRSCRNSQPTFEGGWFCDVHQAVIPEDVILTGCPQWRAATE